MVSESEHDDFGDGEAFYEHEGAIGAEDPQPSFGIAPLPTAQHNTIDEILAESIQRE